MWRIKYIDATGYRKLRIKKGRNNCIQRDFYNWSGGSWKPSEGPDLSPSPWSTLETRPEILEWPKNKLQSNENIYKRNTTLLSHFYRQLSQVPNFQYFQFCRCAHQLSFFNIYNFFFWICNLDHSIYTPKLNCKK